MRYTYCYQRRVSSESHGSITPRASGGPHPFEFARKRKFPCIPCPRPEAFLTCQILSPLLCQNLSVSSIPFFISTPHSSIGCFCWLNNLLRNGFVPSHARMHQDHYYPIIFQALSFVLTDTVKSLERHSHQPMLHSPDRRVD